MPLMRSLSERASGSFYFLEDPAAVKEVFHEEVTSFLVPLAADVRLDVDIGDAYALRAIYGTKADGLINACAVRCFLQPDLDAARFIAPQLGATRHVFTGERKPLAEDHDLMGRGFADDILALGRGEHPARLGKRYAFDEPVALLPVLMAPEAGRSGAVWRDLRPASRMLVS